MDLKLSNISKAFFFGLALLVFSSYSQTLSAFENERVFAAHPNRYFIESGSNLGGGIQYALNVGFSRIYSIELSRQFYNICSRKFSNHPNVILFEGDSVDMLPIILKEIDAPATFWLDGHYSGGDTARGKTNTPILLELEIIAAHPIKNHTILIDDVRFFGTDVFDFIELDQIIQKILEINPNYKISFKDGYDVNDILVAEIPK